MVCPITGKILRAQTGRVNQGGSAPQVLTIFHIGEASRSNRIKEISFTEFRSSLHRILAQVQLTGRPVRIVRRGKALAEIKPSAVTLRSSRQPAKDKLKKP
jgi:hypothetical protein